jgi:hypothetical protein
MSVAQVRIPEHAHFSWQRVRNRINGREGVALSITQTAVRVLWDDAKNAEDVAPSVLEITHEARP